MNIPGYDAWKLRGPDENAGPIMEACENCDGVGSIGNEQDEETCPECDGTGQVETEPDEPDSDYFYERARDAKGDA